MGSGRASVGTRLQQGLATSVSGNAQAFGFSITITVSFGVIDVVHPSPRLLDLFLFALSAVAAFAILNVVVVLLLRGGDQNSEGSRATLIGTATDFLAVGAAIGVAIGAAQLFGPTTSWVVVPFLAGAVYVAVQSIELAVGREQSEDD